MQVTINLPPDLEQDLIRQAAQSNMPLQTLILQALRRTTQSTAAVTSQWSEIVIAYAGTPDFPAFEAYRDELLPPHEPELF
ncbi:MAG: hypothetical protein AAF773_02495 [Cyanobacteria bacterium P01_D01_bin.115]